MGLVELLADFQAVTEEVKKPLESSRLEPTAADADLERSNVDHSTCLDVVPLV